MKKSFLLLLLVLILFLSFLPRFMIQRANEERLATTAAQENAPPVRVMKMRPRTQPIRIVLPSYLDAIQVTPVWARTNGYVREMRADIGDEFEAGQILAILDTPDIDAAVIRAEGELAAAAAREAIANITAVRWTRLYGHNPESLSKEDVDVKMADFEAAKAAVIAAEGNLDYWKTIQSFKYVAAPFDGIITSRTIDVGTLVTAGSDNAPGEFFMATQRQELYQIARTDILRAFVDVPQSLFYLVEDGLPALVAVWQYPGQTFQGKIVRNTRSLDPKARTLLTQVDIDNSSKKLRAGLYAEVQFEFIPKEPAFVIPVGSLIIRNGPPFVAVVKKNKVHLQEVKIGVDRGRTIQILSGIAQNDTLIIAPTNLTVEGMTVKPVYVSEEEEQMLLGPTPKVQGSESYMG